MKVIYFAHPYGGEFENYSKSCGLAAILTDKYPDYHIFNATRHFVQFKDQMSEGEVMSRCIDMVGRCDALWLAPGWKESTGCTLEHFEATKLGLPIRYLTKDDFKESIELTKEEQTKQLKEPREEDASLFQNVITEMRDRLHKHTVTVTDGRSNFSVRKENGRVIYHTENEDGESLATIHNPDGTVSVTIEGSKSKDYPSMKPHLKMDGLSIGIYPAIKGFSSLDTDASLQSEVAQLNPSKDYATLIQQPVEVAQLSPSKGGYIKKAEPMKPTEFTPVQLTGITKLDLSTTADVVGDGVGDGIQIKIDKDVEIAMKDNIIHVRRVK